MSARERSSADVARAEAGERLAVALEEQVDAYRCLLDLGRSKQEALVDGDIADLRRIVLEEQVVLSRVLELEKTQAAVSGAFSRGADGGGLSWLPAECRERVLRARAELSETAAQLSLLVRANSDLIRRARSFVDLSLSCLSSGSRGPAYDGSGNVAPLANNAVGPGLSRRL